MLFSDLQKQLSPSPIKTWRLLKQLRDHGRMKETDDFIMQDRKLYVNVPRFIVELEELGYANLKSNDFKNGDMKSDDIMELVKEMKLISSEITESRIQEEMQSNDFSAEHSKPHFEHQDPPVKSAQPDLKSDDFREISREIIEAKNEVIDTLKESVRSKDTDVIQLRAVISELSQQNKTLTQQNGWLTNLLVAPKAETEPMRSAKVKVTEVTDDVAAEEEMQQDLGDAPDVHSVGTDAPTPGHAEQSEMHGTDTDAEPPSDHKSASRDEEMDITR